MASSTTAKGKIGIIGSGLIGRSWALIFASAGYNVTLYDIEESQLTRALVDIEEQLANLQKIGLLRGTLTPEQQRALISVTRDMKEAVTDALHVQECVPENEDLKRKTFSEMEKYANDATVLCSSASCIVPSKFTEHLQRRSQCIVAHPTNPPYYCPLVEIIPNPWTDPSVISRTRALMEEAGQVPVTVKREIDGFALNRMQYAIINEAYRLVADGVMSPEDVDKVFTAGLGMRYAFCGPFEVIHLNAEGTGSYFERYGSTIKRVSSTFGPTPTYSGEALDALVRESNEKFPLDKLQEIRQWRDSRLVALAKLKQDMEAKKTFVGQNQMASSTSSTTAKGKIGIIGSGLIGRSWALIFASAGYNVTMYDIEESQLTRALVDIEEQLANLQKIGLLRGTLTPEQQRALISVTRDMKEAVTDAVHVQECVPENEDLKRKTFSEMEKYANDATVLCSSVSCIVPSKFTEQLQRRSQCIVAHPTNPPYYCPLVEIIPNQWTDPSVISRTRALMEEAGQVPVTVKREIDGFALNRMQFAIIDEAYRLVADGVMSPEDVDKVFTAGLGMRYAFCGPFEVIHLNAEGTGSYFERYGSTIKRVSSTFGPTPTYSGEAFDALVRESNEKFPLDKLQEIRQWRDSRLVALAKLKQDMEAKKTL